MRSHHKFAPMQARDRRALLLGACIVLPGLFIPFVVKPYLQLLAGVRAQTVAERDQLTRERRAILDLSTLPEARVRTTRQLDVELSRLFQASNNFLATADLAQYVATVSQDNGLRIQASETGPSRSVVPGVQALEVEVRAEGDLDGILHFLSQLESGGKLVRIGALTIADNTRFPNTPTQTTISANQALGGDRDDVSSTRSIQNVEVLSLSASVYGYRLSGLSGQDIDVKRNGAPSPFSRTAYSFGGLNTVLDRDLFNTSRSRPSLSYRLAMLDTAHHRPTQMASGQRPYQQPNIRLIGTVVTADSAGFVICQTGGAPFQVVHVGERIADYILTMVSQDVAVFTSTVGERFVLQRQQEGTQASESNRLRRRHQPATN